MKSSGVSRDGINLCNVATPKIMATPARSVQPIRPPSWLLKFIAQDGRSDGWTLYLEGSHYALAKKTGKNPEFHLFENHAAIISVPDRDKHRLLWKGNLTRAGREYIALTLALSNAAGKIIRADGKAQCAECRKLMLLGELERHPCKEKEDG